MKDIKITNASELKKIDKKRPYGLEILKYKNGEIICTDYITTNEQWDNFVKWFDGDWLQVCEVREDTNTAILMIA